MINFGALEARIPALREAFQNAVPFEHLIIDDFADADRLRRALKIVERAALKDLGARNDNLFQKNKYENPRFFELCDEFQELHEDYLSLRFQNILRMITGDEVFIDPDHHGGGLHLGVKASKLDMHSDFSHHPKHPTWFRNLNVLLYLNDDWQPEYGGALQIRDDRSNAELTIEPLFNRLLLMQTRSYTIHGHGMTNFPAGKYRTSIAAYAYDLRESDRNSSTTWYPEGNPIKRAIGRNWTALVRIKTKIFGSRTDKLKSLQVTKVKQPKDGD